MKEENITIKTFDGFDLRATLCIPEKIEKITILCHGITCDRNEYLNMFSTLADRLAEHNIGSLRFDFRGHGESSGKDLDFDIISQLIDLRSVVEWVKSESDYRSLPMSFVGTSFGGIPGIIYQRIHGAFRAISLFAPVIAFNPTFVNPTTEWGMNNFSSMAWEKSKKNGYLMLDGSFRISVRLLEELLVLNPLDMLKQLEAHVQIFHGTEDDLIPCSVVKGLKKQCPLFDIHVVPDMGHGLYVDGDDDGITDGSKKIQEEYYYHVTQFLAQYGKK